MEYVDGWKSDAMEDGKEDEKKKWQKGVGIGLGVGMPLLLAVAFLVGRATGKKRVQPPAAKHAEHNW